MYSPKAKIAVASSFEGVVNDGAPECALVAMNSYYAQGPGVSVKRIPARDFPFYRNGHIVKAFLAMRPMVEVAEDYRTVLDVIIGDIATATDLARNPSNVSAYSYLEKEFQRLKQVTKEKRDAFGKGKESLFYKERAALQRENYNDWLNLQQPFEDTLPQFRALVDTQVWGGETPLSGFYPRFATSKDEASTHALCAFYTKVRKLDPSDVEGKRCLIPRDGVIGMETVPSRNKVEQLKIIAERLDVPLNQVWRLNDRYDPKQQEELHNAGFQHQFFLPGYATPHEIERAKSDKLVRVLDRKNFAGQLGAYAEQLSI